MKKAKDWTVDILSKRFTVKWKKCSEDEHSGECYSPKCEIWIDPVPHMEAQKDTLLHECIHALDHELATKMSERQVGNIATALLHFMRANPEVIRWMIER